MPIVDGVLHRVACLLLLLWITGLAWGQRHALDEPRFSAVGDTQSINDGVVTALAEDADGLLWIGTTTGVLRHDGYQLRPFAVGEAAAAAGGAEARPGTRFVRTLLAAPGGVLWVGLEGEGLARLDTGTQRWTLYRPDPRRPGALAHGTVRALALDADGVLWVGTTGGGLYSLAPQAQGFQHHGTAEGALPDDRVHALRVDRRGTLWVGTWKGLVRKARGASRFEPVFSTPGGDGLAGRSVSMVGEGPDGRIWVGTRDGALVIVDPATGDGQWLDRGGASDDPATTVAGPGGVASFVVATAEEVWIGRDRGLDLRDARSGELVQRLRRSQFKPWGLAGHNVVALLRDASGQVWVGSYGGGLQRHNPSPGIWVRRGEGAEDSAFAEGDVRSLHQLRTGEVWAGTPSGAVLVFDAGLQLRHQILPAASGRGDARFAGGLVGAITQAADGTVWVGSDSGVHAFATDRRLKARWSVGGGRTRRLLAAADGMLWAATQDGVYRLRAGQPGFERMARADGQPLSGNVNALAQGADGTVWVGANAGLFRVAPRGQALQPVPAVEGGALGSPVVLGLLVDRSGQLWVDTNAGLHRWRSPGEGPARFEAVAGAVGGGTFGANLLEDGQGRIWTHQNVYDPRTDQVQTLTPADGVDIGTGWFRAYTALADGRLLFGGSTGVLVVEPGRLRPWRHAPPLVVTDLRVNGERLPPARLQPSLVLAPDQRSFSVEFAALDYSQPERNRYRHKLDGFDADWIETGADFRVASYGNLAPGEYRLQVQGSNRLGAWSPHALSLPVRVLPAWWQTWWARGGLLLLVGAGIWGLVQLRTGLLRRHQAELEAKVRERTQALEALSRELQMKSAELEASSLTDPLTGLYNRRFLTQHMNADAALVARRHGEQLRQRLAPPAPADPGAGAAADPAADPKAPAAAPAAPPAGPDIVFFLVDIDHFKAVNDRHGHAAGDAVLLQVCERLKAAFREADYVVRWGGEEFLVAAREASRGRAAELAERARQAIAGRPFTLEDGGRLTLTASIGFAAYPLAPAHAGALDWTTTVELADAALYMVKRGGRDGWFGLLQAEAPNATALREASGRPLAAWIAAGGLQVRGSRPFEAG